MCCRNKIYIKLQLKCFTKGLQLILNVQQEEYMPGASEIAGVIVVIQDQNTMPFPEDDGITVGPGHSTSIDIRKVRFSLCSQN